MLLFPRPLLPPALTSLPLPHLGLGRWGMGEASSESVLWGLQAGAMPVITSQGTAPTPAHAHTRLLGKWHQALRIQSWIGDVLTLPFYRWGNRGPNDNPNTF